MVVIVVLSLKDINLQSVVHSGTCQVTFTARDVGVSIRIRGMVQDGYVRDKGIGYLFGYLGNSITMDHGSNEEYL